jgi:Ca-activated chloride channel family protein
MKGELVNWRIRKLSIIAGMLGFAIVAFTAVIFLATGHRSLATLFFTPDQVGYRHYLKGEYEKATEFFADSLWKGVSFFKQGDFNKAATLFSGLDTAEAAFNHGNALVMQGKYEEAVGRYDRALDSKPEWEEATVNREIALARAEMLKREGGDMTGGKMGADEIVFSEGKPSPSAEDEQVNGEQPMSDAESRAMWLRRVQTRPADFLRAKFAYQVAHKVKGVP